MKKVLLSIIILAGMSSCTENQRARTFGGTSTVELPKDVVVVNASWKKEDLWLTLKNTTTNEVYLQESSSFGLIQGTVKFKNK